MASEWCTRPRDVALDERYGHVVGQTTLKGNWYRRALIILSMAEKLDGPEFRDWMAKAPENWIRPDRIIFRALSEVPADPDANS